ncbi:hypothetical protein Vafri_17756 [Volvox africanus]|nr:hypothetical protein Vafri_17756 [Volvox africanus]
MFGITSYMAFSKYLGPAMPFLGGAAFGFIGGLVHRYLTDKEEAQLMLSRYPKIIEYHINQVEPMELRDVSFDKWLVDLRTNMRKQGVLISALYSASDTITKLQEEEEERILEKHYRTDEGAGTAAE